MTDSPYQNYYDYLAEHVITPFYNVRLEGLQSLKLASGLKRKNPYLLKAKNIELAVDLVRSIPVGVIRPPVAVISALRAVTALSGNNRSMRVLDR